MVKSKISKTVSTDGTTISYEYAHFFLKGQWFLCYVIGDIKAPVCSTDEADKSFSMHLEEWDCKNYEIITWFCTITLPSIRKQFGIYENTKDIWDVLTSRYTIDGLSHEYQL